MGNDPMAREDVLQLLRETECPEEFTQQFAAAIDQESIASQLRLLRAQRHRQLERLHDEERKLDQLDYLRYRLEKQLPGGAARKGART